MPETQIGSCVVIGTGVLTWDPTERRSDRYGYVWLMKEGGNSHNQVGPAPLAKPEFVWQTCRLIARILETRPSTHIGDLFHGVSPRTPNVGEAIVLGVGILDFKRVEGDQRVGLIPEDRRPDLWLDIRALYDTHEQTVELVAELVNPTGGDHA